MKYQMGKLFATMSFRPEPAPQLHAGSRNPRGMPGQARHDINGFTVVELILTMGILTIILMVLTQVFVSALDVQLETEATSPLEQDARFVLNRLHYDVGRASSVALPASIGEQGGTLELIIGGSTVRYSVADRQLMRTQGLVGDQLTGYGTQVVSLIFERSGNAAGLPVVRATIRLQSTTQESGGTKTRELTTAAGLR